MSASSVVIIVILMLGILLNIIMRSKTMNSEKAFIWGLLFLVILITPKIIFGSGISSSWDFVTYLWGVAISVRFFLFNLIRWIRLSVRECRKWVPAATCVTPSYGASPLPPRCARCPPATFFATKKALGPNQGHRQSHITVTSPSTLHTLTVTATRDTNHPPPKTI